MMPFSVTPEERFWFLTTIGAALAWVGQRFVGRKAAAAELARTDMEVGKSLRDELRDEIARQDAKIDQQDAECQRRLDAMDTRLKAVQSEADAARDEARSLRTALDAAEKLIGSLKRQVAVLTRGAAE